MPYFDEHDDGRYTGPCISGVFDFDLGKALHREEGPGRTSMEYGAINKGESVHLIGFALQAVNFDGFRSPGNWNCSGIHLICIKMALRFLCVASLTI